MIKDGVDIMDEKQARRFLRLHDVDEVKVGTTLTLPPCEPEAVLAVIRERHGRPCPRVELDPENGPAASLASLTLASHLNPLVAPFYEATTVDLTADQRVAMIHRVVAAVQDERVVALVEAAKERGREQAKK